MHKPVNFRKILTHDVRKITEKPLVSELIFTVVVFLCVYRRYSLPGFTLFDVTRCCPCHSLCNHVLDCVMWLCYPGPASPHSRLSGPASPNTGIPWLCFPESRTPGPASPRPGLPRVPRPRILAYCVTVRN